MLYYRGDQLGGAFLLVVVDDRITDLDAPRNPDKLLAAAVPRVICR